MILTGVLSAKDGQQVPWSWTMIVGSQSELHSVTEPTKGTEGNTIVLGISKMKSSFDGETQSYH